MGIQQTVTGTGDVAVKSGRQCPVTRQQFLSAGPARLSLTDGENVTRMDGTPREFSTGSFGYYFSGKVTLDVGGVATVFQVTASVTAVGSKDAK